MKNNISLKVLHISTSDLQGGAARATYRLHQALLANGIDSTLFVQNKTSDDNSVIAEITTSKKVLNKLRPTLDGIPVKLYIDRKSSLFSPSYLPFSNVIRKINEIKPNLVHLHWICHGMISVEDIAKINVPIVWTLHDNWAFTGGCHNIEGCEKYQNSCGSCPKLASARENDLSRKVFKRKQKIFSQIDKLVIVGVSRWLVDCIKKSKLLGDRNIVRLPNPLDTNKFKPFDVDKARELWCLPKHKKIVLFGANSATVDPNKGFLELCDALGQLKRDDIEFVVFGGSKPKLFQKLEFKTHYLGHVYDDISLVTIYNAADIMVVPSLQEAFGQTASESMACGTPVVAFGHTGLLDIVDHKKNGYLAQPIDTSDLAHGIEWMLDNKDYDIFCSRARNKVLNEFDCTVVAESYVKLYNDILND